MNKSSGYKHLSFEERFTIEKLYLASVAIRVIANLLKRSPNTVSREIKNNSVNGAYLADKARHKSYVKRRGSKSQCFKVVMNPFLFKFVEDRLQDKWSPHQISGFLSDELGVVCSPKAIYKFAKSRCLERLLFWGWNKRKRGLKRYKYPVNKDNRKYIDLRPPIGEVGNYEMDFIVSKKSSWVLLVVVDRLSKKSLVVKLPNRKHATITGALSRMFHGVNVKSITTDNDIAFVCWKEIESLLHTQIYFTHPYHSWEKGLVENTNRWIRCFVPKKRDIGTVTKEEMREIHSFLNDRPRKIIGYLTPTVYHSQLLSTVLVQG